jgi:cell division septation protein DedD
MDIARYIGLFLLKNHFCYIHGLGNLEMKKKSAFHDGTTLNAPAYHVIITPGGSIDDTLANFIATNEQISISKASNALRDFSTQAKADLQEGKEVVIPSLGKFLEEDGKVIFITDPHMQYTPPGVPVLRNAPKTPEPTRQQQQQRYEPQPAAETQAPNDTYKPYLEPQRNPVNWGKIGLIVGLGILVVICVVFAINYFNSQPQEVAVETKPTETTIDTLMTVAPAPAAANTNSNVGSDGKINYKILLQDYNNVAKAERRMKTLVSYGYTVEIAATADSTHFYVLLPVSSLPADTTHVLDSISRVLKPSGVSIYR